MLMLTRIFSLLQGAQDSSSLWIALWAALCAALNMMQPGLKSTSVNNSTSTARKAEGFIDDTDLWLTETTLPDGEPQTIVKGMSELFQRWCTVLRQSGGLLGFKKCFWCLMHWKWHKGKARMEKIAEVPSEIKVDTEDEQGMAPTRRLECDKGMPTLGVRLAPDCNQNDEHKCRLEQSRTIGRLMHNAPLSRREVEQAHDRIWWLRVGCPLSVTTFVRKQCDKLQAAFQSKFLQRMGYAKSTATETRHGPSEHGGIGINTIWNEQGVKKTTLTLKHARDHGKLPDSMLISMSHSQLEAGIGAQILTIDYKEYGTYTTPTWITQAWEWLSEQNLKLHIPNLWVPQLQRENDRCLMLCARTLCTSNAMLQAMLRCRLYLKVTTLSDMLDATGKYVLPEMWKGTIRTDRQTRLNYPNQGRPPTEDWTKWRKFLTVFLTNEGANR